MTPFSPSPFQFIQPMFGAQLNLSISSIVLRRTVGDGVLVGVELPVALGVGEDVGIGVFEDVGVILGVKVMLDVRVGVNVLEGVGVSWTFPLRSPIKTLIKSRGLCRSVCQFRTKSQKARGR